MPPSRARLNNPLSDFGSNAGFPINFDLIQTWQNGQSTTITLPPNTRNDLGDHFTKVEIYNAQTTGTIDEFVYSQPYAKEK